MGAVTAVPGVSLLVSSSVAAPPPQDPLPPNVNSYSYGYGAQDDGHPGGGGAPPSQPLQEPAGGESDHIGPHDCLTLSNNVQVCAPAHGGGNKVPKVSPRELALTRWAHMPIPAPVVRTAPPRGRDGLVGLPEWFFSYSSSYVGAFQNHRAA
ncbi:hypothetical protein GCM10009727_66710 [Actinomadura napierensis]|uniref:Uncharacterized protein n=1 Tax=Actinomadura napierensis TaxID=267854 RepID=A0ABP5M2E7_9ACTN